MAPVEVKSYRNPRGAHVSSDLALLPRLKLSFRSLGLFYAITDQRLCMYMLLAGAGLVTNPQMCRRSQTPNLQHPEAALVDFGTYDSLLSTVGVKPPPFLSSKSALNRGSSLNSTRSQLSSLSISRLDREIAMAHTLSILATFLALVISAIPAHAQLKDPKINLAGGLLPNRNSVDYSTITGEQVFLRPFALTLLANSTHVQATLNVSQGYDKVGWIALVSSLPLRIDPVKSREAETAPRRRVSARQ